MRSGTTLTLAVLLGITGVVGYWFVQRHPAALPDTPAIEAGANDEDSAGATQFDGQSPGSDAPVRPRSRERNAAVAGTPLGEALDRQSRLARHRALFELAERADLGQLPALVAQARTLDVPADRRDSIEVLLLRWFELAPQAAPGLIDAALAEPAGLARSDFLTSLAEAWVQVSGLDAWAHATRIPDANARLEYSTAVLLAWGERDPERALQSVMALRGGLGRERLLRLAGATLARNDPQRAIELAGTLRRTEARSLIQGIVTEWAEHDIRGAAQWLTSNRGRAGRGMAWQLAERYGALNPVEALAWAQKVDRSTGMRDLGAFVLAGYADSNPQDALRMALAVESEGQRRQAIGAVLSTIALRDPAYAMENFDRLVDRRSRIDVVQAIVQPLMRNDPRAAIEWLKRLDDRAVRTAGLSNAAAILVDSDPGAAMDLVDTIPEEARMQWIGVVAQGMAVTDAEAAARWLRGFQSDPAYARVAGGFAIQLNRTDAQAAFEFAASITDIRQRDQILQRMMSSGPMAAPEVAARWLERISDEHLRPQAAGNIASQWAAQDPAAARKWATSLAGGPSRDQALSSLLGSGAVSFEDMTSILNQIQSGERRMDAVWQAAMNLSGSDLDAARTLIRRHPLDPSRRDMLARMVREQYGVTL